MVGLLYQILFSIFFVFFWILGWIWYSGVYGRFDLLVAGVVRVFHAPLPRNGKGTLLVSCSTCSCVSCTTSTKWQGSLNDTSFRERDALARWHTHIHTHVAASKTSDTVLPRRLCCQCTNSRAQTHVKEEGGCRCIHWYSGLVVSITAVGLFY